MGIAYYLAMSGGLVLDGDASRILIIRNTGRVLQASRHKIEVGDILFVPTRVMASRLPKTQSELDKAFGMITNGLISFAILRAVVK
jgi:hypothetical protein